jgi:hypothetical protein
LARHWRVHDKQWIVRRIRKFTRRNERYVQHDNEIKIHHPYPSTERIYSEFIWQVFTGGLFLYKSFSSVEQTRRILISWKARGVRWWTGNHGSTSHLLCSVTELPTKTIMGDRGEDMLFSVMVSRIGIR